MNDKGGTRRARPAPATVAPAVDAAVERAAIERADTDPNVGTAGTAAPAQGEVVAPATGTAILPEPTLIAEPGKPMPIVTASPPLTGEPDALDVATVERLRSEILGDVATQADRIEARTAAAGQPMLAIEGRSVPHQPEIDRLYDPALYKRSPGADVMAKTELLSVEALIQQIERLSIVDHDGFQEIRQRCFAETSVASRSFAAGLAGPTMVEVVGPAQGRRRAGRMFGPTPQRFPAAELGEDAIKALRADPLLVVAVSTEPFGAR